MKKNVFALLLIIVLLISASPAEEVRATRAYFEDLDKESRLENIVEDIGNYGIEGSGILYFVWHLDDGSKAKVVFDSKGRIAMIYIIGENSSERIYRREYPDTGAGTDLPGDPDSPDLEDAVRGLRQAIGRSIPPSGRIPYPAPDVPMLELSDITGDGCPELWTCVTWGSGMVRTDLVVYDPVLDTLYVLDGYNYDYRIDHAEEDRIVVVKTGPNGYGDPVTKTYGTVQLENNELVFIADSGE